MNCYKHLYLAAFLLTANTVLAQGDLWSAGLPVLKTAVYKSFVSSKVNPACSPGGQNSVDKIHQVEGSATAAKSIVRSLVEGTQTELSSLSNDSSKCGSCRQVNQVVIYTTSEPAQVNADSSCDNRPTVNIQIELPDSDIQIYAESTLKGDTPQGQQLYQGCPDPCAFNTASAATPAGNGRSLLNLTVHCGQPRTGFILFAKYKFSSGLIHKWVCQ